MDFIEIAMRVEKELDVALHLPDLQATFDRHQPPDITVDELVNGILECPHCATCQYDLRGHGHQGTCPECGSSFGPLARENVFSAVRDAIVATMQVRSDEVQPDALLIRQLGVR
jgi:hypothetical protein